MDHFRSMYKSNTNSSILSSKECKRNENHENRAKKRTELYNSTRNISPSPSSTRNNCSPRKEEKENFKPMFPVETELEEVGSGNSKTNTKLSRQKAHLLKFLAWKTEKAKQAQIKGKSKRAPFVVSTRSCAATGPEVINNIKKPSFAPVNHIFRPPATLQSLELKVIGSNSVRLINGTREETYHFLATPKKYKHSDNPTLKHMPVPRAAINKPVPAKTSAATPKVTKLTLISKQNQDAEPNVKKFPPTRKPDLVLLRPKSFLPQIKRPTFKVPKKSSSSISNALVTVIGNTNFQGEASTVKLNGKSILKTMSGADNLSEQVSGTPTDTNRFLNIVTAKKKPSSLAASSANSFFVQKGKLMIPVDNTTTQASDGDKKPLPILKPTKLNPISVKTPVETKRVARLPLNHKQKLENKANVEEKMKPILPLIKRPKLKAPKKSSSSISNAFMAVTKNIHVREGRPKVKLIGKSVVKNQLGNGKPSEHVPETPTDANQGYPFLNVVTSTKRKSLSLKESSANSLFVEMDKLVSPVDDATKHSTEVEKFNFLRYSVVQSDSNKPEEESRSRIKDEVQVTPNKAEGPQTPTTYLSPYVSVSRGKVGIKIEREKRNSVYMSVDKSITEDAETTAKARHTIATIHYYRKQLTDEITRLNGQCDTWQQYKEDNAHMVEDSGLDMINVTIGQTKLLTTKKLKQFGDLIDRCEAGAMGKKSLGKGDGAKPILTEDLEGFWSMVGLQIENVDKRFANLQRWKENNWKDPDEVPEKSYSYPKKMKKLKPGTTTGPNRDLQKILKNAQAAFLRKKKANSEFDEDVILTPSKNRQVLIRDRRSRSAAATVITVNTPKVSRKSSALEQMTPTGIMPDTKVLPHVNGFRKSMNLFKSALFNKHEKKSPGTINCATPLPLSRKSILKTPGSIRRPKSVIFNSPTLQFTMEDKVENESPPQRMSPSKLEKKKEEERTYALRTRNIKLRDLADIIIPK